MEEALLVQVALAREFPDIPITIVQDGDKGLQSIQDKHWSLAIIDLNLPGLDGIELIQAAATFKPGLATIAVTGYTSNAYLDGAYRAGAVAVMTKPLDLPEFVRTARDNIKLDRAATKKSGPTVLAIAAKAGDVEAGCGGILLKHNDQGHHVVVAIAGQSGPAARVADSVGGLYEATTIFNPGAASPLDEAGTAQWIEKLVEEHGPLIMYVPSVNDRDALRATTQRAALKGGAAIPKVLGYQTPEATIDFEPKVFVDIGTFLDRKLALVRQYEGFDLANLGTEVVESTARYWGRFAGPDLVEPLEVLRG